MKPFLEDPSTSQGYTIPSASRPAHNRDFASGDQHPSQPTYPQGLPHAYPSYYQVRDESSYMSRHGPGYPATSHTQRASPSTFKGHAHSRPPDRAGHSRSVVVTRVGPAELMGTTSQTMASQTITSLPNAAHPEVMARQGTNQIYAHPLSSSHPYSPLQLNSQPGHVASQSYAHSDQTNARYAASQPHVGGFNAQHRHKAPVAHRTDPKGSPRRTNKISSSTPSLIRAEAPTTLGETLGKDSLWNPSDPVVYGRTSDPVVHHDLAADCAYIKKVENPYGAHHKTDPASISGEFQIRRFRNQSFTIPADDRVSTTKRNGSIVKSITPNAPVEAKQDMVLDLSIKTVRQSADSTAPDSDQSASMYPLKFPTHKSASTRMVSPVMLNNQDSNGVSASGSHTPSPRPFKRPIDAASYAELTVKSPKFDDPSLSGGNSYRRIEDNLSDRQSSAMDPARGSPYNPVSAKQRPVDKPYRPPDHYSSTSSAPYYSPPMSAAHLHPTSHPGLPLSSSTFADYARRTPYSLHPEYYPATQEAPQYPSQYPPVTQPQFPQSPFPEAEREPHWKKSLYTPADPPPTSSSNTRRHVLLDPSLHTKPPTKVSAVSMPIKINRPSSADRQRETCPPLVRPNQLQDTATKVSSIELTQLTTRTQLSPSQNAPQRLSDDPTKIAPYQSGRPINPVDQAGPSFAAEPLPNSSEPDPSAVHPNHSDATQPIINKHELLAATQGQSNVESIISRNPADASVLKFKLEKFHNHLKENVQFDGDEAKEKLCNVPGKENKLPIDAVSEATVTKEPDSAINELTPEGTAKSDSAGVVNCKVDVSASTSQPAIPSDQTSSVLNLSKTNFVEVTADKQTHLHKSAAETVDSKHIAHRESIDNKRKAENMISGHPGTIPGSRLPPNEKPNVASISPYQSMRPYPVRETVPDPSKNLGPYPSYNRVASPHLSERTNVSHAIPHNSNSRELFSQWTNQIQASSRGAPKEPNYYKLKELKSYDSAPVEHKPSYPAHYDRTSWDPSMYQHKFKDSRYEHMSRATRASYDHPASVAAASISKDSKVDPNTFLPQSSLYRPRSEELPQSKVDVSAKKAEKYSKVVTKQEVKRDWHPNDMKTPLYEFPMSQYSGYPYPNPATPGYNLSTYGPPSEDWKKRESIATASTHMHEQFMRQKANESSWKPPKSHSTQSTEKNKTQSTTATPRQAHSQQTLYRDSNKTYQPIDNERPAIKKESASPHDYPQYYPPVSNAHPSAPYYHSPYPSSSQSSYDRQIDPYAIGRSKSPRSATHTPTTQSLQSRQLMSPHSPTHPPPPLSEAPYPTYYSYAHPSKSPYQPDVSRPYPHTYQGSAYPYGPHPSTAPSSKYTMPSASYPPASPHTNMSMLDQRHPNLYKPNYNNQPTNKNYPPPPAAHKSTSHLPQTSLATSVYSASTSASHQSAHANLMAPYESQRNFAPYHGPPLSFYPQYPKSTLAHETTQGPTLSHVDRRAHDTPRYSAPKTEPDHSTWSHHRTTVAPPNDWNAKVSKTVAKTTSPAANEYKSYPYHNVKSTTIVPQVAYPPKSTAPKSTHPKSSPPKSTPVKPTPLVEVSANIQTTERKPVELDDIMQSFEADLRSQADDVVSKNSKILDSRYSRQLELQHALDKGELVDSEVPYYEETEDSDQSVAPTKFRGKIKRIKDKKSKERLILTYNSHSDNSAPELLPDDDESDFEQDLIDQIERAQSKKDRSSRRHRRDSSSASKEESASDEVRSKSSKKATPKKSHESSSYSGDSESHSSSSSQESDSSVSDDKRRRKRRPSGTDTSGSHDFSAYPRRTPRKNKKPKESSDSEDNQRVTRRRLKRKTRRDTSHTKRTKSKIDKRRIVSESSEYSSSSADEKLNPKKRHKNVVRSDSEVSSNNDIKSAKTPLQSDSILQKLETQRQNDAGRRDVLDMKARQEDSRTKFLESLKALPETPLRHSWRKPAFVSSFKKGWQADLRKFKLNVARTPKSLITIPPISSHSDAKKMTIKGRNSWRFENFCDESPKKSPTPGDHERSAGSLMQHFFSKVLDESLGDDDSIPRPPLSPCSTFTPTGLTPTPSVEPSMLISHVHDSDKDSFANIRGPSPPVSDSAALRRRSIVSSLMKKLQNHTSRKTRSLDIHWLNRPRSILKTNNERQKLPTPVPFNKASTVKRANNGSKARFRSIFGCDPPANSRLDLIPTLSPKEPKAELTYSTNSSTPATPAEVDASTGTHPGKKRKQKKFRSGFDYIPKKKKKFKDEEMTATTKKRIPVRKKVIWPEESRDVAGEVRSWVINKGLGETILHKAARLQYHDVVVFCLESGESNVNMRDNAGYTPLHEACNRGHLDIVNTLLAYGAKVNAPGYGGMRPLHEACDNGHLELVRLLMAYGADINLTSYAGQPCLALADQCCSGLIDAFTADIKARKYDSLVISGPTNCFDTDEHGVVDFFADLPQQGDPEPKVKIEDQPQPLDMMFECSDMPLPPTYNLRTNPHVKYMRLSELTQVTGSTQWDLIRAIGSLETLTLDASKFALETTCSDGWKGCLEPKPVVLVKYSKILQDYLGVEVEYI